MKKKTILLVMMLFLAGLVFGSEIEFVDTYGNALKLAAERDQQVLVTFYTDW